MAGPPEVNIKEALSLEMTGPGFELYVPPTPMINNLHKAPNNGRFVMLDDINDTFYDVDYDAAKNPSKLGNEISWADLALHMVPEPAIVFPSTQWGWLNSPERKFSMAFLVSIDARDADYIYAKKIGSVFVRKVPQEHSNWPAIRSMKGEELPAEMAAGLLRKVWNTHSGDNANISYVTPASVLDKMESPWHRDGASLNWQLDHQYAGATMIASQQRWRVRAE